MKQEKIKENLLRAGYPDLDARYLDQVATTEVAESGKRFFNPITMEFNLGGLIVTYDELEAAKQVVANRLNLLRQSWSLTPLEIEQEQIDELNFQTEELGAKLNNEPLPNRRDAPPKLSKPGWSTILYGESIPFEWAVRPFHKGKSTNSGTLLGLKDEAELQDAISRVFPNAEAARIVKDKKLMSHEAALVLIDSHRRKIVLPEALLIPNPAGSSLAQLQPRELRDTIIWRIQSAIIEKLDKENRKAPSHSQVFLFRCRDKLTIPKMRGKNIKWSESTIKSRLKSLKAFLFNEFDGLTFGHFDDVDRSVFSAAEKELNDQRARTISPYAVGEIDTEDREDQHY